MPENNLTQISLFILVIAAAFFIGTLFTKVQNLEKTYSEGETETRAWTILNGWTAPLAGTAIHTDFKVISCEYVYHSDYQNIDLQDQQFGLKHFWNVGADMRVILQK